MSRTPRSRRPPLLGVAPAPATSGASEASVGPSLREQLKDLHVAGRNVRIGSSEMRALVRRLADGEVRARLGLGPFERCDTAQVEAAIAGVFGWDGDGPRGRIDPDRTIQGFAAACDRVLEVARRGGRVLAATSRPASLLGLHRALVAAAGEAGATVVRRDESAAVGLRGMRLWWVDGVAVATDREALCATDDVALAEELLLVSATPDLVLADGVFAGVALRAGHEVVAFAGLEAAALAVAAWRGMAARIVPLDDRRPADAYRPLVELLDDTVAAPSEELALGVRGTHPHRGQLGSA
jgi:hypothetical protein